MGLSTPLLMAIVKDNLNNIGRTIGVFYGANILGAATGCFLTGFIFIELFGFKLTTAIAAVVNMITGLLVYLVYLRAIKADVRMEASFAFLLRSPLRGLSWRLCLAAFLFGFVTLGFEMVAFRVISNQFMTLAYIFPLMLMVYLLQMSLGECAAGVMIDRWPERLRYLAYPVIFIFFVGAVAFSFHLKGDGDLLKNDPFGYYCHFRNLIGFTVCFLIPVFFLSGYFPVMVKCSVKNIADTGRIVGLLLFIFTVSSGIASIATPFFLFEKFGTIGTVFVLVFLCAGGVLLLAPMLLSRVLVILGLAFLFFIPTNYYYRLRDFHGQGHATYKVIEDHNGVLHLTPLSDDPATSDFLLRVNRTPTSNTVKTINPRDLTQYNCSEMVAVKKDFRPQDILVIGMGGSEFTYGILQYDFVKSVTVIELYKFIYDAVKTYSGPEIQKFFEDPRMKVIIGDGRKFINQLQKTGKKYDLIQIGVCLPFTAGGSSVYTVDFFRMLKNLLNPGGMVVILEMPHPVESGLEVFRFGYKFSGNFGGRQFYLTDQDLHLEKAYTLDFKLAAMARIPDEGFLRMTRYVRDKKPFWLNTDDRPVQEYYVVREFLLPKLRFLKFLRGYEWTSSLTQIKSEEPSVISLAK
jgi:spermidine synthase